MLAVTILVCVRGIREYNIVAKQASSKDPVDHQQYEDDVAFFASQSRRQNDSQVSWCSRAPGKLRTRWLAGSAIFPVRGDPWQRNQRLFVVVAQVLISMAISIQFYQSDLDPCETTCNVTSIVNTSDLECSCKTKECECLPNGLQASLLTAAIALPFIGLLNLSVRVSPRN